jgi:hypothetical protein
MRIDFTLSKRQITRLIFVTGQKPFGYTVRLNGYNGCQDFNVSRIELGNAIVRTLREIALRKPDLFPLSVRPIKAQRRSRARSADA